MTFTHVVLQAPSTAEVLKFMETILASGQHPNTCIIAIVDNAQRRGITAGGPQFDYKQLQEDGRLEFMMKPCKPQKFLKVFDPANVTSVWLDDPIRAQQKENIRTQREAYVVFKRVLGDKGIRVLAVEDNLLQMQVYSAVCFLNLQEQILIDSDPVQFPREDLPSRDNQGLGRPGVL
jgi:hypothetical protein